MCDAVMPNHTPDPEHTCVLDGEHKGKPHEAFSTFQPTIFAGLRICWFDPVGMLACPSE